MAYKFEDLNIKMTHRIREVGKKAEKLTGIPYTTHVTACLNVYFSDGNVGLKEHLDVMDERMIRNPRGWLYDIGVIISTCWKIAIKSIKNCAKQIWECDK